jgi:hypothetical protein
VRRGGKWVQESEQEGEVRATVTLGQDSAWKLFTKRVDRQAALTRFPDFVVEGDQELGMHLLDMMSVMA